MIYKLLIGPRHTQDTVKAIFFFLGDSAGLMEGNEGFDSSRALWKKVGWKEVKQLRQMLENLPELRILVRSLGRSGGKGPKRRAPQEV